MPPALDTGAVGDHRGGLAALPCTGAWCEGLGGGLCLAPVLVFRILEPVMVFLLLAGKLCRRYGRKSGPLHLHHVWDGGKG